MNPDYDFLAHVVAIIEASPRGRFASDGRTPPLERKDAKDLHPMDIPEKGDDA